MPVKLKMLSNEEYNELVERGKKDHSSMFHYFEPGMGYYNPWYYDPTSPESNQYQMRKERGLADLTMFSLYYWQDWSDIRSPITVFCPNKRQWCIDQKSTNGNGWKVIGYLPNITCTPSIVCFDYHGFLTNGEFTDDIEGRSYENI